MLRRHEYALAEPSESRRRSALPIVLTAIGFAGGFLIAVFYSVALHSVPADSTQRVPKVTITGPHPAPVEPTRSYPSVGQAFRAPATDGWGGGDAANSPEARAQAARERSRIDKIMQICTGC